MKLFLVIFHNADQFMQMSSINLVISEDNEFCPHIGTITLMVIK